jgi:transcriptional regulator with XRE-family HTH domain
MNFLGKNIRFIRKQRSKTQSELASMLGKGQTTIGNWENGISEPNLEELVILSNYFDISLDLLIKTDLAMMTGQPGSWPRETGTLKYDHAIENINQAREDQFTYVLQEIKNIRKDLERINSRMPPK